MGEGGQVLSWGGCLEVAIWVAIFVQCACNKEGEDQGLHDAKSLCKSFKLYFITIST